MAGSVLSSDGSKIATDTEWSTEIISLKEAPDWTVDRCKQCQRHKWQPAVVFVDPIALNQKTWFDLDRVALLKDEINAVRELIELEPNSRYIGSFPAAIKAIYG
ncbi:uncharacterized protein BYT42DRAFT_40764 [Radiomyces spectabilis]|uniref:uncharacterized protein n=1 Tax=Radiomyces spectabilis TaxID=64574 RepID=UPI00221EFF74|nr:uncharacterized protein BYT42DRAFT_40764 [Radiomyces spectabilis]KAI8394325.1 hypothetical protein BYT42DRAFT_40764 [Radiomyces spectabilis]